jgi:hypothetical protein
MLKFDNKKKVRHFTKNHFLYYNCSKYVFNIISYKDSKYWEKKGLLNLSKKKLIKKFLVIKSSFKHNKTREQYGLNKFFHTFTISNTRSPKIFEIFLWKNVSLSMFKYILLKKINFLKKW